MERRGQLQSVGASGSRGMSSGRIMRSICPECDCWALPLLNVAADRDIGGGPDSLPWHAARVLFSNKTSHSVTVLASFRTLWTNG